jgi:hypothetical protein
MIWLRCFDLLYRPPVPEISASADLEFLCRQENGRKTEAKKQAEAVTEWATRATWRAKPAQCRVSDFLRRGGTATRETLLPVGYGL